VLPDFGKRLDLALRQPLTRIIANAETIRSRVEGPIRGDYAAYAADIANAGRHLMELVDDLADLQAIDRPNFTVAREEIDLADIARRAAGLLGVKAADRGLRIEAPKMDETAPAIGEFRRALQIAVNLLGNAVRYSPENSTIWLRAEAEGDAAMLVVADQGRGIALEDQQRVFEKFERLGRDDAAGTGLGLYISRRLARAMQGDILIDSAPGQGARFTLSLPARD
jgi:signal transduction histidine kinase